MTTTPSDLLPHPLVHYQFGCDAKGQVEIVQSGPLMETLAAHHQHPPLCHLSSNGMISPYSSLHTNATIQELQEVSVNADAFVVELWMTVRPPEEDAWTTNSTTSSSSGDALPILSFTDPNRQSNNGIIINNNNGDIVEECAGFEVELALREGRQLELRYVDHIGTQNICRVLIIRHQDLVPYMLQHVVMVWRNGATDLYLNGVPMIQGAPNHFDTTLSLWNPLSTLQLFGSRSSSSSSSHSDDIPLDENTPQLPNNGNVGATSINMLSIYNEHLTDRDVVELYRQGEMMLDAARLHREPLHIHFPNGSHHLHLLSQGQASSLIPLLLGDDQGGIVVNASSSSSSSSHTTGAASRDWLLLVEITSLPFFGSLYRTEPQEGMGDHGGDANRLEERQRIWLDNVVDNDITTKKNTPLGIWYRPHSQDFFNAPSFSFNGTSLNPHREFFTYRLLVVPKGSQELFSPEDGGRPEQETMHDANSMGELRVLATSEIVEQELIVIHVNHPPVLKVPEQVMVDKSQPSGVGARPRAHLKDVQVLDAADWDIDRIRVDLWARSGTLTLSKDVLPLADFATCRASERQALLLSGGSNKEEDDDAIVTWSCHGNGIANRNMTFLATPSDASQILSHVQYDGFDWDQADELVVRLSDGVDGACLSQQEHRLVPYRSAYHKYHTIHDDECFQVFATISIPPIPLGGDRGADGSSGAGGYVKALFDVGNFGWADGIFWGFVLLAMTGCCLCLRSCIRFCGARGAKIHIEDEEPMEEIMTPRYFEDTGLV